MLSSNMRSASKLLRLASMRLKLSYIRGSYFLSNRQYSQILSDSEVSATAKNIPKTPKKHIKELKCAPKSDFVPQKLYKLLSEEGLPHAHVVKIVQVTELKRAAQVSSQNMISLIRLLQAINIGMDKVSTLLQRAPFMFSRDPDKHLWPKLQLLEGIGISRIDLGVLVMRFPYALYAKLEKLRAQIEFLKTVLADGDLCKVIINYPWLLRLDAEGCLRPRIELLISSGIKQSILRRLFLVSPRVFCRSVDKLSLAFDMLQELGFERGTPAYSRAFVFVASKNLHSIRLGVQNFLALGFSQHEVQVMFQAQPSLIGKSRADVCKKVKYLCEVIKRPVSDAVRFPVYLLVSFEARIRPRYEALLKWKTENNVEREHSLSYIICVTDEYFHKRILGQQSIDCGRPTLKV